MSGSVAAVLASWFVLLLWAAGADWRAPPLPAHERVFPGSRFSAAFGKAEPEQNVLLVTADADDHSSLQRTSLPELEAAEFSLLRYRFRNFPQTLELALMFRSAENPDEVETIALPWPGAGSAAVDLSRIPSWHGRVIELGFAEFATPHSVPPERGFRPFELVEAELWSPSWYGSLRALGTDWFGSWSWSQRSVHALGREGSVAPSSSMVVSLALAAGLLVFWVALLAGFHRRRWVQLALVCSALVWLALDLRWQAGLSQRLHAAQALYGGLDWSARAQIVGDSELLRVAAEVRAVTLDQQATDRVLVYADNVYETLRLIWHLLPLNAGMLAPALRQPEWIPDGSLIVLYDGGASRPPAGLQQLLERSERLLPADGEVVGQPAGLRVYRYHHAP